MTDIHETAVVHPRAELDSSVAVGPYCTIGARVKIGAGTRLISHIVVDNDTTLGCRNTIYPFASIGSIPQDLKFNGEPARLILGDDNVVREGATLNIGTEATMETRIGNHCLIMAYAHVAHDCVLGDHVVMTNAVGLAGHVEIGDHVIMGGHAAVHQYCRVGSHAFIAGGGMVTQDVPPFCIAQGDRAQLVGVNIVGLKRRGWTRERIAAVRDAFQQLFKLGPTRLVALENVERSLADSSADVRALTDFVRASTRGICPPRVLPPPADNFEG